MQPFLMRKQKKAKEELKFLRNNTGPTDPHAGEAGLVSIVDYLFFVEYLKWKKIY